MNDWNSIISNLKLISDSPTDEGTLFYFDKYEKVLIEIIRNEKSGHPLSILIDGEWGSGKTSLLKRLQGNLGKDVKVILFNPWMYENLDPLTCLMQTIVNEFDTNRGSELKGTVENLSVFTMDLPLRKKASTTLDEIKESLGKVVEQMPTIPNQLEKIIKNQQLIILVDDLDRCSEENAINILNSIKLFFNAKNIVFVVAADISVLQKAWELKYTKSISGITEARKYFDKIFQIRISLPPKDETEITSFIKNKVEVFSEEEQKLILKGCPPNPRILIKLMNALFVNSRLMIDKKYERIFPLLIVWSIVVLAFPSIADRVRRFPQTLIYLSYIFSNYNDFEDFFFHVDREEFNQISNPIEIKFGKVGVPIRLLNIEILDCVKMIMKKREKSAFQLFRELSNFYKPEFDTLKANDSQNFVLESIEKEFRSDVDTIVHMTV